MPRTKSANQNLVKSSREIEQESEVKDIVNKLFHYTNSFSHDTSLFAKGVTSVHPTIQQNIMRLFVECMREWATMKEKGWYDLRNEQTCVVSEKIIKQFKNELLFPNV